MRKKSPYRSKTPRSQSARNTKVDMDTVKVLRTVSEREAFYFYEDIGKPTGQASRSLCEFLEEMKTAKVESLQFHLERGDFQNWIKEVLGDSKLAEDMRNIKASNGDEARSKLSRTVENRLNELKATSQIMAVAETVVMLPTN